MANRRFTANDQIRVTDNASRPGPVGSGGNKVFNTESTAAWPGAPGDKGPKRNAVSGMFHEVKQSAKQDMADDLYGHNPASIGMPLPAIQVPGGMPLAPGGGRQMPPMMGGRPVPIGTGLPPGFGPPAGQFPTANPGLVADAVARVRAAAAGIGGGGNGFPFPTTGGNGFPGAGPRPAVPDSIRGDGRRRGRGRNRGR